MTVGSMARRRARDHWEAVRRLRVALEEQERLAARLGDSDHATAQERLSAARASVAVREEWLHWIDEASSLEPWADGVWAPGLVELVYAPPDAVPGTAAASWVAPALADSVRQLRERLGAFATEHHVDVGVSGDLRLAASEALTNVVVHAYRDRVMPGTMTASITIDRRAGRVELSVADEGIGMVGAPRPDSPGCGLGLVIIAAVSEEMSIRPGAGSIGTVITFGFRAPPM